MKKYKSILKDRNGELVRQFVHETRNGAEIWCNLQKDYPGGTTEIEEFEYEFKKPEGFDEYLDRVKAEVERIGRGYTCNFMWKDQNVHHINGYNHFVFSLEGDKVHPLGGGGSLVVYIKDFTKEEFIAELGNILIKSPYVYRDMADVMLEELQNEKSNNENKEPMTTKEQIINAFNELNEDANRRWENEKILELCNYKEDGDTTMLTIGIGKWDTTFHDLVIDSEGIEIKQESEKNKLLDDVIEVIKPFFFE